MMKATVKETAILRNGVEMPLVGLGVMHMYGSECVRAICEAIDAGYQEAENGDPHAQCLVGKLYQDGPVLIPDSVEALYWFEQAAQQGHTAAQYELGKLLLSHDPEVHNPELGIQWLECAAQNKNGYAAYRLGKEYLKGEIVEKNTPRRWSTSPNPLKLGTSTHNTPSASCIWTSTARNRPTSGSPSLPLRATAMPSFSWTAGTT